MKTKTHATWRKAYRAARMSSLAQAEEWRMEMDLEPWPWLCHTAIVCLARRQLVFPISAVRVLLRIDPRWRSNSKRAAFLKMGVHDAR